MVQASEPLSISVSIVVFRPDLQVLGRVLHHLEAAFMELPNVMAECYLIDNTPDGAHIAILEAFIKSFSLAIKFIANPANTGYGAGNNLAIRASHAQYHLVLNPDVFMHKEALKVALNYLEEHAEVGLLCPKILNEDGSMQFVHRKHARLFDMFLRSAAPVSLQRCFQKRMDRFLLKDLDWSKEQDIPSPSGCCMLFRMQVLKEVHGFDERFFMYYEDSDIGRRIGQIAKIKYLPSFVVTHMWARASRKSWKMRWVIIKSGWQYFLKWGGIF